MTARVPPTRADQRLDDLQNVVEANLPAAAQELAEKTLHATSIAAARKMMSSEQLKAFDVQRGADRR